MHKLVKATACLLLPSVLAAIAHAQSMTLPGQFAVSETGAATYTIPIELPPGVGGIEPKLALAYSSYAGNGLLGMGWNLQGLSAITRCSRTMAQDGVRGSVNYDLNDRYCLDGQRLVLVSGTEGGNGAEYRIERENFGQVIAYTEASISGGPARFLLRTKSGLVMNYGNTENSRMSIEGSSAIKSWNLNEVRDKNGNVVKITYESAQQNEPPHPTVIQYSSPNSQPSHFVSLNYSETPYSYTSYTSGSKTEEKRTINSISINHITTGELWRYIAEYSLDSVGQRKLEKIKKCSGLTCVERIFIWNDESGISSFSGGPYETLTTTGYSDPKWKFKAIDVNGDGRQDVVATCIGASNVAGIRLQSFFSNLDGRFQMGPYLSPESSGYSSRNWQFQVGDFNGDGLNDLIATLIGEPSAPGIRAQVFFSDGTGGFSSGPYLTLASSGYTSSRWKLQTGDLNGDGMTDLAASLIGTSDSIGIRIQAFFSQGNGQFSAGPYLSPETSNYSSPAWSIYPMEINGDGLVDLVAILIGDPGSIGIRIQTFISSGNGAFQKKEYQSLFSSGYSSTKWRILPADINGDGKTDFAAILVGAQDAPGIRIQAFFSMGNGKFLNGQYFTLSGSGYTDQKWDVSTSDFNGDGRDDFAIYLLGSSTLAGTRLQQLFSRGNGEFVVGPYLSLEQNGFSSTAWSGLLADVSGDGISDFIAMYIGSEESNGIRLKSYKSSSERVSLKGASTYEGSIGFSYSPLSLDNVYSRGEDVPHPKINTTFPMTVVSTSTESDGLGGFRQTNYRYGNAVAELGTGRGFLGFEWVQSEDVGTGVVNRTWYRQDWPFTGLVSKVERGTSAANRSNLGVTTYTYACTDFDTAPGCQSAPGKRYFPFVTRVEEKSWDLNGAALPITRTDTVYDCGNASAACFGNALDLTVSTLNPDGSPSGYSKRTQSQFYNDTNNWILGRLLRSSVIHTSP